MDCFRKLEKLESMIKKFRDIFFLKSIFLILISSTNNSLSLSPEYQKQLRIGCYSNSKQFLGAEKAQEYCTCTIEMLSEKYNDQQIDELFSKKPEEIMEGTEFASKYCEIKNKTP